jgi:hypothetical protein
LKTTLLIKILSELSIAKAWIPISIGRCFGVVRQDEFPFNAAISGSKFGVADDANSRSA